MPIMTVAATSFPSPPAAEKARPRFASTNRPGHGLVGVTVSPCFTWLNEWVFGQAEGGHAG